MRRRERRPGSGPPRPASPGGCAPSCAPRRGRPARSPRAGPRRAGRGEPPRECSRLRGSTGNSTARNGPRAIPPRPVRCASPPPRRGWRARHGSPPRAVRPPTAPARERMNNGPSPPGRPLSWRSRRLPAGDPARGGRRSSRGGIPRLGGPSGVVRRRRAGGPRPGPEARASGPRSRRRSRRA